MNADDIEAVVFYRKQKAHTFDFIEQDAIELIEPTRKLLARMEALIDESY